MATHKTIQLVTMSSGNQLFILDFDENTDTITYRRSAAPKERIQEIITADEKTVFLKGCDFPLLFLNNFIYKNREHYPNLIQESND